MCVKAIFFASLIWLRVLEAAFVLMPAARPASKLDWENILDRRFGIVDASKTWFGEQLALEAFHQIAD